jgi:hypothetical protein
MMLCKKNKMVMLCKKNKMMMICKKNKMRIILVKNTYKNNYKKKIMIIIKKDIENIKKKIKWNCNKR